MALCDLCNATLEGNGTRLSAAEVRSAVQAGLRPPAAALELGQVFGSSKEESAKGWAEMVMSDPTDWALCAACGLEAHARLGARPAVSTGGPGAAGPVPLPAAANAPAALAALLALLDAQEQIIPGPLRPAVSDLDGIAQSMLQSFKRAAPISLVLALLAGGAVGNASHSFFAGIAGAGGVFFLLDRAWEFASWRLLRRQAAMAAAGSVVPPDRASEIAVALYRERLLFARLKASLAGLAGKTLSNDLTTRLVEALVVTVATGQLKDILKPTRDLARARSQLKPVKELTDSKETRWSPVIGAGRTTFAIVAAILDNREGFFAALDGCERRSSSSDPTP
jgi:hypothetical protein